MTMTKDELNTALKNFTGSETWYRHELFKLFTYTEGVQFLAEEAGAYWLIDFIFSYQLEAVIKAEPFQCWTLTVRDNKATVTCDDGNSNIILTKTIEFTDVPLDEVKLWFVAGVLLRPSEY